MKFLKKITAQDVISVVVSFFILTHLTPALAARTHMLFKGHPIQAFAKAAPTFEVSRKGFLYFAQGNVPAAKP